MFTTLLMRNVDMMDMVQVILVILIYVLKMDNWIVIIMRVIVID